MAVMAHTSDGMRLKDKMVFRQFCHEKKLWILVRQTNRHSLKYIGVAGYTPKPISVKPKTAQCNVPKPGGGAYELRGLVLDPTRHFQAFEPGKLSGALNAWTEFSRQHFQSKDPNSNFKVDEDKYSPHYGALMIRKGAQYCYIHGDYDLKDIVEVGTEDWNLALPWEKDGVRHNVILLLHHDLKEIRRELNRRIGTEMVQHGSEAQYAGHAEDEPIIVFSPHGHHWTLKDGSAVLAFYQNYFKGRVAGIKVGAGTFIRG